MIALLKPRLCKVCGDPIVRAAPLSPKTCSRCYFEARRVVRPERAPALPLRMTRTASTAPRTATKAALKEPPLRKRSLLDLAHEIHFCTNCEAYVVEGCEPAHANGETWGKGLSMKAGDEFHAALCPKCHRWADQPIGDWYDPSDRYPPTREGRQQMLIAAYFKTQAIYWRNAWLMVTPRK